MIVALDGPAGSGKSSSAQAVAERTGLLHVDTGLVYRMLALIAKRTGRAGQDGNWHNLLELDLSLLEVEWVRTDAELSPVYDDLHWRDLIREADITAGAAYLAQVPAGRSQVIDMVRVLASNQHLIVSGRDTGTAIFPDAPLKIFLTADLETRATRRLLQRGTACPPLDILTREMQELDARDRLDRERPIAPLRVASDAVVIDTTDLTFDQQVQLILDHITMAGFALF
jgi:cytidylate kinase